MRVIVDDSRIQKRTRIGERAPFIGLVILAVATVLIFMKPEWLLLATILVTIGFITSLVGSYLGDRYVGPMAHYKRVPEALKGLDAQYVLLMYETPMPFVLIEPGGVTVITVKSQGGDIRYQRGRWRHREKLGLFRRMAGQESLGRPHRMAEAEAEEMRIFLEKRLPADMDVPVRAVLLFINPNIHLEAEDSPVPALRSSQIKRWLRKDGRLPRLPEETRQQLLETLDIA